MCGRCQMIYADAEVRHGLSCSGQSSIEFSSRQIENNGWCEAKGSDTAPWLSTARKGREDKALKIN